MKSNYYNYLWCFAIILYPGVDSQIENLYEKCIMNDGLLGECLPINRCQHLYSNIEYHMKHNWNYLKANQCGYYNNWPMICCQIEKSRPISKFKLKPEKCIGLQQSIFRGRVPRQFDYTWLATLYIDKPQNIFCSGVLITEHYVLTAAHCLVNFPLNLTTLVLRLGERTISKPDCTRQNICEQDISINLQTDVKIHEHYNQITKKNDIALIRLRSNYTKSTHIQIGCIPTMPIERRWDLNSTEDFNIAGWGQTETTNVSDVKLEAIVKIVPNEQCKRIYAKYGIEIDATQICARGVNQEDTCTGDSGSSLSGLIKGDGQAVNLVFGITSFGIDCGTDKPGVYTRVGAFLEWIENNTDD